MQTPYRIYGKNGQNRCPIYDQNAKNQTLWDRTLLFSPYKIVTYPPPPPRSPEGKRTRSTEIVVWSFFITGQYRPVRYTMWRRPDIRDIYTGIIDWARVLCRKRSRLLLKWILQNMVRHFVTHEQVQAHSWVRHWSLVIRSTHRLEMVSIHKLFWLHHS